MPILILPLGIAHAAQEIKSCKPPSSWNDQEEQETIWDQQEKNCLDGCHGADAFALDLFRKPSSGCTTNSSRTAMTTVPFLNSYERNGSIHTTPQTVSGTMEYLGFVHASVSLRKHCSTAWTHSFLSVFISTVNFLAIVSGTIPSTHRSICLLLVWWCSFYRSQTIIVV